MVDKNDVMRLLCFYAFLFAYYFGGRLFHRK